MASVIVRSTDSASFPLCDDGIPRWSSINLQVDDHFLLLRAIGLVHLVHLVLHERPGTLIPYFVVQNALRISHVLDQRSLNERLLVHIVCEDITHLRDEFLLRGLFHMKVNNEGDLGCHAISLAHEEETQPFRQSQARTSGHQNATLLRWSVDTRAPCLKDAR